MDGRHHHIAVLGIEGSVHHKKIAVVDAGVEHGIAVHAPEERRRGTRPEVLKVDRLVQVNVGRRGEARAEA